MQIGGKIGSGLRFGSDAVMRDACCCKSPQRLKLSFSDLFASADAAFELFKKFALCLRPSVTWLCLHKVGERDNNLIDAWRRIGKVFDLMQ